MKRMGRKRLLALVCFGLILSLSVCVTGCGDKKEESAPKKQEQKNSGVDREDKERKDSL